MIALISVVAVTQAAPTWEKTKTMGPTYVHLCHGVPDDYNIPRYQAIHTGVKACSRHTSGAMEMPTVMPLTLSIPTERAGGGGEESGIRGWAVTGAAGALGSRWRVARTHSRKHIQEKHTCDLRGKASTMSLT